MEAQHRLRRLPLPHEPKHTHTAAHGITLGGSARLHLWRIDSSVLREVQFTLHLLVDHFLLRERIWVVSHLVKRYSSAPGRCQEALARPGT